MTIRKQRGGKKERRHVQTKGKVTDGRSTNMFGILQKVVLNNCKNGPLASLHYAVLQAAL
jgi:hypothetical protein